jgi:hypothetical protein
LMVRQSGRFLSHSPQDHRDEEPMEEDVQWYFAVVVGLFQFPWVLHPSKWSPAQEIMFNVV